MIKFCTSCEQSTPYYIDKCEHRRCKNNVERVGRYYWCEKCRADVYPNLKTEEKEKTDEKREEEDKRKEEEKVAKESRKFPEKTAKESRKSPPVGEKNRELIHRHPPGFLSTPL